MAYRTQFLLRNINRTSSELPIAFFLTDPNRTPDPTSIMEHLLPYTGVIYRHFGAKNRFEIGDEIKKICSRKKLTFLISADKELENHLSPDGIHWPKSQISKIKMSIKHGKINTTSAHSFRQISRAQQFRFDACLLSSIFPSKSPSAPTAMGLLKLRKLDKPIYNPIVWTRRDRYQQCKWSCKTRRISSCRRTI